jgi:hypothetical protein
MGSIGTLRESDLHAALKRHYARPSDQIEVAVDGYVIDIVRGAEARGDPDRSDELIEIQTGNFAALKHKLPQLLENHRVRVIYPIAQAKWITRVKADGKTPVSRRKSPRRGTLEEVFLELVSLPELMAHPNFTLEVVLIYEEEWRCPRAGRKRDRAREWRVCQRRLLEVIEAIEFAAPSDFQRFIPIDLPAPFTSRELAGALQRPDYFAHKITYCLRKMGVLTVVGKRQRAWLYEVTA